MSLTEKQKHFCREYFTNGGNATKAYLTAYNSESEVSAANEGSLLLKREDIQEYLGSLNRPLEKKAISERDKKRQILWGFINDESIDYNNRLRAFDILNKMDSEYIQVNRNINEDKTDISKLSLEALRSLSDDV